ncbi:MULTISPECIES: succinate CoA transferase [unclassified Campylobacter]|uniref:succinate CoA transferase n=2 Tax=Campylobacter TaxID=194 RepID=UPI0022E9C368|nr:MULTISPECIES: succinate CoA transferase [unclassified Campylobacter]MDA3080192.1 succinate CoA transferase [Campylobacter sp. CS_NA2]MDA3081587.1 succinate CoA transferase [Campylobacter sp. CS_NA1]MDA3086249.1 succinate CoA transferase [Campylobacter sp. CS_ED1]WBR51075.1 succinate CoA transferase [Campylobacter sp. CS_NA3]
MGISYEKFEVSDTSRVKNKEYLKKVISATEAVNLIPHGALIGFGGFVGAGAPIVVPMALAQRAEKLHADGKEFQIKALTGASTDPNLDGVLARAGAVSFRAPFNTDKDMRIAVNSNKTKYMDIHLSSLAQYAESGFFGEMDFAIVEISGITEDGKLIPSTSVGNAQNWLNIAKKVILEVNISQPLELEKLHDIAVLARSPYQKEIAINEVGDRIGTPYLSVDPDKVVAVVVANTPDRVNKFTPLDEISIAIGDNVVKFFENEVKAGRLPKDTLLPLQSGVGNIPNAVLAALKKASYKKLNFYTEVIQDGLLELIKEGIADTVSSASLYLSFEATQDFRENINFYSKHIVLRPQELSNNPEVIRRLGVIAMNGMLEADIYGNVNSTNVMGTQMMNGIGGSGDFARNGYISIFLTPSTAKGGAISSIVPFVSHVDHTEHDTMVIVSEYGYADLRGKSPRERAKEMIKIAHPDYREALQDYFDRACANEKAGHTPHILSEALSWHDRFNKTGSMKKA